MIILEQTRRATRAACERVRQALIELDELFQSNGVFTVEETEAADKVYSVVHDDGGFVVMLTDPTMS